MLLMCNGKEGLTWWWHRSEESTTLIKPFTKAVKGVVGVDIDGMQIKGWVLPEEYTLLLLKGEAS